MVELDKTDRRILAILQKNNQITNLELAERTHLSPPTCLRRVRQLRDQKVITADVSLVNPLLVDKNLFAIIEVVLERQIEKLQEEFEKKMEQSDEVMQCYMVSGHTDFLVIVQVADMQAFHRFVRKTLTDDPNIRNFHSLFAISRTKFRTEINLGE
jgi:Lrp/AsnC family leucine-responsive transcriptional regulator